MTTIDLYRKHKAGKFSREKFLYEVRRDNNLPFITNLTSYDDAVKILKNRGIVNEGPTKEAKADEAVKAEVKPKKPSEKKPSILHIDQANPYEYRHGLQHELRELDDYNDEALEKAKDKVLKNLAKDANYYSTLLNQKQSPYEFKQTETDAKGMQAKADGHLKKELKKDEKSNVKDTLGKKEAGKKKPKGVKIMPDKGVTGSEKTIKEGLEVKQDDDQIEISADSGDYVGEIENGKVSFSVFYDNMEDIENEFGPEGITSENWKDILGSDHAFVKIIDTIGGDVEAIDDYVQITVDVDKLTSLKKDEDGDDGYDPELADMGRYVTEYLKEINPNYKPAIGSTADEYMKPRPGGPLFSPEEREEAEFDSLKMKVKGWYRMNFANPKSQLASKWDNEFYDKVEASTNKNELKQVVQSILMGDTSSAMRTLGLDEIKKDKHSNLKEMLKKLVKEVLKENPIDDNIKKAETNLATLYTQKADALKQSK
jgi:hypothetical protein